jgi:hypothetical protein
LRNNRPQFGIFKTSIRNPKKIDYVLPVGLGGSSSPVARGVEFESNKAKGIGNSNLPAIQYLLVCRPFDAVEGLIVNDHQIEGREIRGSLKLQKGLGFEKGPIAQAGQNSTRGRQLRVGDQQIQIESVPQVTMQNNRVASNHQEGYTSLIESKEYRRKNWHGLSRRTLCAELARLPTTFHRDPADRIIVSTARTKGAAVGQPLGSAVYL